MFGRCDADLSLLDSDSLPSAWGTRQRLYCTRQSLCRVWHSAKHTRQKIDRQSTLCRVYFIGHSAKALPSAPETLGKEKRPSRRRFRWRSLCRVSTLPALGKDFFKFFLKLSLPSANTWGTRQRASIFFLRIFFAECQTSRHSAKIFYFFFKNSLPSANPEGTRQRAFIFFWKFSLPSANTPGTRQSLNFFLNFFAECYSHSTRQSWKICFLVAHFASFAECCDHCARQRGPLLSATLQSDPKRQIFFFCVPSWQIHSYKHISHIYLIHHIYISYITYISHPSTHSSAHNTSITICNNKCSSPSK